MPSVSKKQHNFMEAIAHSQKFAKKVHVPQKVGKDFVAADKGKTFKKGGEMKDKDLSQDKAMIKKAFKQHDMQEHKGGKGTSLKLAKGGMDMKKKSVNPAMSMMAGRAMRTPAPAPMRAPMGPMAAPAAPMGMGMKSGGRTPVKGDHAVQKKAKVGAKMIKMAAGGKTAQLNKANGVATKGRTKVTEVKMASGGSKRYC